MLNIKITDFMSEDELISRAKDMVKNNKNNVNDYIDKKIESAIKKKVREYINSEDFDLECKRIIGRTISEILEEKIDIVDEKMIEKQVSNRIKKLIEKEVKRIDITVNKSSFL